MGILGKIGALLTRGRRDDELREEIDAHIALRHQSLVDAGMDPRDADREARRLFGNTTALREESLDMWRFARIESWLQDVRFGSRMLVRTPLFTVVAILSLAAGIGSAVAVFAVADAILFRPLPVHNPGELRAFRIDIRLGAATKTVTGVPDDAFAEIQRNADFADYIGFRIADGVTLDGRVGTGARTARVEFVSPKYFEVLGVTAARGRLLDGNDHDGATPVVISERLARAAFNGDALGRTVTLNGNPGTVVGVVRSFTGLVADQPADVFVPLGRNADLEPRVARQQVRLVGRLRPGISTAVAEQRHAALYRVSMPSLGKQIDLHPTLEDASRGLSDARPLLERPLRLGLVLVAVLLLVACANTGALLLSRFVTRRNEFGIRAAIGAGRWRLARQLAIEALLVSLCAAAIGLAAGWLAAPILVRVMPEAGSQVAFDLRFDSRLVGFTLALALACAAAAVTASLFRLSKSNVSILLAAESRSATAGSRRTTQVLIAAQIACSVLLAIGAVSMARTLINLREVPVGFDPRRTFVAEVTATGLVANDAAAAFHGALHERIAAVPGVNRATMAQVGILTASATTGTVDIAGFTPATDEDRICRMFFIGPNYFDTLGMPFLVGRAPSAADGPRSAVVNERFARFYFGGPSSAVGRFVNTDMQIVGVVADAHYNTLRDDPVRALFVPYGPVQRTQMVHVIRTNGAIAPVMAAVRDAIVAHDGRLRPTLVSGEDVLAAAVARETFLATVATVLAALAVALACAGVYAVVAYSVSRRQAELAVRLALGASTRDVIALVLRDPLVTALAGAAAGIPGAYLLMRSARSLLFDVAVFDPTIVLACAMGLVACGLLAAAWPASRATRVDPVGVLRHS
jgi:predicted permease